jgi:hypothetical protein
MFINQTRINKNKDKGMKDIISESNSREKNAQHIIHSYNSCAEGIRMKYNYDYNILNHEIRDEL